VSGLPNGWAQTSLRDIATFITSGSRGWARYYADEGAAFVRVGNIKRGTIALDWDDMQRVNPPPGGEGERTRLQDDDVLITITADLGRVAVFREGADETAYINQHVALARLADGQWARYVAWYLASDEGQSQLLERDKGTTKAGLGLEDINAVEVPFPPPAEQRRIVAKLDALTARTARARADLDRIPALAARYKQAVLAKAFSGELTAEWRRENPTEGTGEALRDQLLQQRTERRRAEGSRGAGANRSVPTDDRALPALPRGWTWMTFDQCSWDLTVGHVGPMKDRYVPNGIPFLRSLNVKPNAISLKNLVFVSAGFHAELRKSQLSAGTIVVIRTGEPGVAAVVPESLDGANCSDLVICRPVEGLNPHFGARYINSDFAKSFIRDTQVGVAQQHFNVGAMSKLPAPVAPAREQAEIVRRVDQAFVEIDRLTAEAASARRLLDQLDQAMLAKAFRGELVPQDPADEPASLLLDRVKVEREAGEGKPTSRRAPKPTRSKEQAMNGKPLSPRERILKDSENWPALGLPFEAIATRNAMPHDQLRDTLFELLAGSSPALQQRFDTDAELMMIKRIAA